jgi:hypothetical protein
MNGVRIGDYGHDIEFGVFITPAAESADVRSVLVPNSIVAPI